MSQVDAYTALATRHGYPDSARYRRILEFLMTPEQARIASELPGSIQEVAQKTSMTVKTVEEELERLYRRGVVFPKDFQKRDYFRFARDVWQIHDATQSILSMDPIGEPELFRLWQDFCEAEWDPDRARNLFALMEQPFLRVIPAYRAIKGIPGILPYEDVREILRAASLIAVCSCSCRKRSKAIGNPCEKSGDQNCMQFNRGAEYAISRGSGRKLSYEEALDIIDSTEEDGLVHTWANSAVMSATVMCSCCVDCCMVWVPLIQHQVPVAKAWAKSRYQAEVDQELCNGCQVCVDRCQFDAFEMVKPAGSRKYKAMVDPEKCWGCGVCVLKCQPEALELKPVRPPEHIPQP